MPRRFDEIQTVIMNTVELDEVIEVNGDTGYRFRRWSDGKMEWGSGTAATEADTNLYRTAAAVLGTDNSFDLVNHDGSTKGLKLAGTFVSSTAAEINRATTLSSRIVAATGATLTVTLAAHDGRIITLGRAAGVTVTLPAASGSGAVYTFLNQVTVTTNNNIIAVANASDYMIGTSVQAVCGTTLGFNTANSGTPSSESDTITMNGTTKGGLKGDRITIVDIATNIFQVTCIMTASGTGANPFSAAV